MKKILFTFFCLATVFSAALPVLAVIDIQTQLGAVTGEQGANFGRAMDPRLVAAYTVEIIMGTVGIIFLAYLVYAGYLMLVSGGEEEKITKGRKMIFQAILGVFICLSALAIANFSARYLKEAASGGTPSGFYAGAGFEIEQDTSQFYNTDPLQQDAGLGMPIFGNSGQATTWLFKNWLSKPVFVSKY